VSTKIELETNNDNLSKKVLELENGLVTIQKRLSVSESRGREMAAALNQIQRDLESSRQKETAALENLAQCEQRLRYKGAQHAEAAEEIIKLKSDLAAKRNKVITRIVCFS